MSGLGLLTSRRYCQPSELSRERGHTTLHVGQTGPKKGDEQLANAPLQQDKTTLQKYLFKKRPVFQIIKNKQPWDIGAKESSFDFSDDFICVLVFDISLGRIGNQLPISSGYAAAASDLLLERTIRQSTMIIWNASN